MVHGARMEAGRMAMKGMKFPPHKGSLHLAHNEPKSNYETVAQAIERGGYWSDGWISEEQKQKAIDTNECWSLQWYPDTPVGFHLLHAADLDALLAAAAADGGTLASA